MHQLIVAIPHYYGPGDNPSQARHGSSLQRREERASTLRRTVMALHQTFGQAQCTMQLARRVTEAANTSMRMQVNVLLCTQADNHLIHESHLPSGCFTHVPCDVPAMELGFACHRELAARSDDGLWFGYIEDDILVGDPMMLTKLNWFSELAGADCVLQPNRFERDERTLIHKAYVDGDLSLGNTERWCDLTDRSELQFELLHAPLRFVRPTNPHSGCFFLRHDQMQTWKAQSHCGMPSNEFIGPLESAASLSLMRTFRVYKPAIENAGFLEVEHQSRQFIGQLRSKDSG